MGLTLYDIIHNLLKESIDTNSVKDSIDNKYYVRIKYDDGGENTKGNPKGSRIIRPDAVGLSKRKNRVLRAFQNNGNSRRGAPNWKYFDLNKIVSWQPLKNKHFYDIPQDDYGKYNLTGDRLMTTVWDKVQYDYDRDDTLNQIRAQRQSSSPKVSVKNTQGPINATSQRKKNVFTSFPNSERYNKIAKEVEKSSSEDEMRDKWADFDKAQQELNMQNQSDKPNSENSGPIQNNQNTELDYRNNDYDIDDGDWYEDNDYFNDRNKNRF